MGQAISCDGVVDGCDGVELPHVWPRPPPGHGWVVASPSGSIFVVQAHPAHGAGALVAALGDEIEPVERAHQQFGAATMG